MPLSISNFKQQPPQKQWWLILSVAFVLFAPCAFLVESELGRAGLKPHALDNINTWCFERNRASHLGKKALILVGASRILYGIDLESLRKKTHLEPVELANYGSLGQFAILQDLVQDPSVTGTILLDYYDEGTFHSDTKTIETQEYYQKFYRDYWNIHANIGEYEWLENQWTKMVHEGFLSYSRNHSPFVNLWRVFVDRDIIPYFAYTHDSDRSGKIDFSTNYFRLKPQYRLAVDLGLDDESIARIPDLDAWLNARIGQMHASDLEPFLRNTQNLKDLLRPFEARGGKIILVKMPTRFLLKEMEMKTYPTDKFWNSFIAKLNAPAINANTDPAFRHFECPDGSHLDMHARAEFTELLVHELQKQGALQ